MKSSFEMSGDILGIRSFLIEVIEEGAPEGTPSLTSSVSRWVYRRWLRREGELLGAIVVGT